MTGRRFGFSLPLLVTEDIPGRTIASPDELFVAEEDVEGERARIKTAEDMGIVEQIAGRYKLKVKDLDRVPHDVWAHATLPSVNSYEALSLVLIQFDLTFQWNNDASTIQIVPLPTAKQPKSRSR